MWCSEGIIVFIEQKSSQVIFRKMSYCVWSQSACKTKRRSRNLWFIRQSLANFEASQFGAHLGTISEFREVLRTVILVRTRANTKAARAGLDEWHLPAQKGNFGILLFTVLRCRVSTIAHNRRRSMTAIFPSWDIAHQPPKSRSVVKNSSICFFLRIKQEFSTFYPV
jgi:hypothetical protein